MHLKFLVCFTINGLNQAQIFEKLRQKGVDFFDVKPLNRFETSFCVLKKDKKIVQSVLKAFNVETLSLKPKSFLKATLFFKKNLGVVLGIFCAVFLQFFSGLFVFQVSVSGTACEQEIKTFIENQGVKPFCAKNLVDTKALELGIIENFPQISMASVIVKGASVVVNVKEKESFEDVRQDDIVADFNGRIKEIKTISGKEMVKPGDIVRIGDVLVSSESENAENGIVAKAKIVAEVWYDSSHTHIETKTEQVRTGNIIEKREVFAFGLEIFSTDIKVDFLNYEMEENVVNLKTILPLKVKNYIYFETCERTVSLPYSDVKDSIVLELKENTLQNVSKDDIILKENVFETTEAGVTTTTYVVVAERHIF